MTSLYLYTLDKLIEEPTLPKLIREHCDLYKVKEKNIISKSNYHYLSLELQKRNIDINNLYFQEKGKPCIDGIHISLAHSNKYFGFVISNKEIGLDIEEIIPDSRLKLADKILTNNEKIEFLNSDNKSIYLTEKWCAKEAYGKMLGCGLNNDILHNDDFEYIKFILDNTMVVVTKCDNLKVFRNDEPMR